MNPFEKRATEYIRDDLAFLPYVTPEPLLSYLAPRADEVDLFGRLVILIGSPGSGKTTLARLFLIRTLSTLLRNKSLANHASLCDALVKCKAIGKGALPLVAGCRVPLESEYRDCWELPYEEGIRNTLMFSLLQARTVLGWLNGFEEAGIALSDIKLIGRADASAALEAVGGTSLEKVRQVARDVERDVYSVTASLLPPSVDNLPEGAKIPYRPFDVVEAFEIPFEGKSLRVRPLVIFDDAHVLHPMQFNECVRWLGRREVRVARWLLTRIDALRPQEVLHPEERPVDDEPGFNVSREVVRVWMQNLESRAANRRSFRKIARDMATRYLKQMPVFNRRGLISFEDLLSGEPAALSAGKLKALRDSLQTGRRRQIGPTKRRDIENLVDAYLAKGDASEPDEGVAAEDPAADEVAGNSPNAEVREMMIRILLERYLRRVPQDSLFAEMVEATPSVPLKADSTVRNAAAMQLFHDFDRPFFYGFNTLCDAATENAERFLRLAGHLVSQLETQIIRGADNVKLEPIAQHKLLVERATRMINDEDLPERTRVLQLCATIADQCLISTLEPNAQLGEGPNAWGIVQSEFDSIASEHPVLASVLQSAVAYNMITLVRDHGTKNQKWCLVELSGTWSLMRGLTLKRGGFLERKVRDLTSAIAGAV